MTKMTELRHPCEGFSRGDPPHARAMPFLERFPLTLGSVVHGAGTGGVETFRQQERLPSRKSRGYFCACLGTRFGGRGRIQHPSGEEVRPGPCLVSDDWAANLPPPARPCCVRVGGAFQRPRGDTSCGIALQFPRMRGDRLPAIARVLTQLKAERMKMNILETLGGVTTGTASHRRESIGHDPRPLTLRSGGTGTIPPAPVSPSRIIKNTIRSAPKLFAIGCT